LARLVRSIRTHAQGHPAKNDCSTEVLLDVCTSVTFLRSVPESRAGSTRGAVCRTPNVALVLVRSLHGTGYLPLYTSFSVPFLNYCID
jgi:hypothetical protein